ncbi:MAG: tetratricopeptide repeat protein [Thiohalophilus sp.]|uniref:tetratricopeptide repeat protein n=1 Tax=Thiohalophilus sp. TaxID=3028392 RepID=UPI00287010FE|nr:tetratricopeptide repeat protein [Thiohalophilus sp.]MDR9435460.1 tetratricopeptide repeat protein [Thiohalophilus sp.]
MSLINQMLKDLEKRRADSVSSPDGSLQGVNRYSVARRRPPYLVYALAASLILLVVLVAVLGWFYLNTPQPAGASAPPIATAPVPAVETAPLPQADSGQNSPSAESVTAGSSTAERDSTEEKAAPQTVTPAKNQTAAKPKPASEPEPEPTSRVEHQPARTGSAVDETSQQVTKRNRPLSDEQRAELAYKKGYQLLGREQTEAGERHLREALQHYRQHHRARELLAGVYIKSGRYVEAATLLKEGVALAPQNSLFAKLYARVLLKQDKPTQAIAVLERQPPPMGVDRDYHALLAAIYQQAGYHLKAAATYRDLLRVNPRQGNWWIGLGVSLEQLEKYTEARSAYERARNSPTLAESLKEYAAERLSALAAAGL